MNNEILKKYGFEAILIDHWRKKDFSICIHLDNDKKIYRVCGVNNYPPITSEEQLREIYKEKTGEDLTIGI